MSPQPSFHESLVFLVSSAQVMPQSSFMMAKMSRSVVDPVVTKDKFMKAFCISKWRRQTSKICLDQRQR